MKSEDISGVRTWLEIDTKAIAHNYNNFRNFISPTSKLCGVVKSNAYGHGLAGFSKELEKLGIDYLAVDSIIEGLRLRKEEIQTPLFVLGNTLPARLREAKENSIEITVSTFELLEEIVKTKTGNPLKIHIKVDTGMLRQGFRLNQKEKLLEFLEDHKESFEITGLYTHFASPYQSDKGSTEKQLHEFGEWRAAFAQKGFYPMVHTSMTNATLMFPETHFDMCRIGIGIYGLWSSEETKNYLGDRFSLTPVLSWKTRIAELKEGKKYEGVGYDLTETLTRDSTVAVCPVGYWHGYARSLSSKGEMLVRGKRAKVLGRVSMDMVVIDVTGIEGACVGDEVVIVGTQEGERVNIEEVAQREGTIPHETMTRINPLIKKVYV